MEQSQRRLGRPEQWSRSRRFKKAPIVAVALVATVGAFLSSENRHVAGNNAAPSTGTCEGKDALNPACSAAEGIERSLAASSDSAGVQNPQEMDFSSDTRTRSPRRAWQQDDGAAMLVPGHTLMELCASSPDTAVTQCRAHKTTELYSLTSGSGGRDEAKELSISGQVLSADGQSLAGVSIVALPERLDDEAITLTKNLRFWTVTDAFGAYSFSGLPSGEYMIRSARQGQYQSSRVSARTGIDYADLIMLHPVEMLAEGRVVDSFGEPLEGVTVFPTLVGQGSVQTGPDGRFELPLSVKPGVDSVKLQFQMAGYNDQSSSVRIGGHAEPTIDETSVVMDVVQSWTSLKGMVTDDDGQPLAGRRVELMPDAAQRAQSTTTDENGRYTFAFVEAPADYQLVVSGGSGFKDVKQDIRVTTAGKEVDVVTEPFETGAVVGQLMNQHGSPVADFQLVLKNVDSIDANAVVRTDSLGNFEIPEAPAGELVISSVSMPSILVKGLLLQPGERIHVSMVLDWGQHTIRGQVVDATGVPVPASRVVLNWSHRDERLDTQTTRRTATDSEGRFAFSNLGPGPHSLKVDAPGFLGVDIEHDLSRQGYDLTVRLN
jgi:protocatechuate 3,4-dioxygenase beta subunit